MIQGIAGVPDGTAATTDRRLFDEGIETIGQRLRFASYGKPAFDAILELAAGWEVPSCVRRIAVKF
jgi:hypothetical protein